MPTLISRNTQPRLKPQALPSVVSDFDRAMTAIGGLSTTSKMPWYSWSISAFDCKVGSKLREVEGSTCSSCYALKGRYTFPNVKGAHERRKAALDHPDFVASFVFVLNTLYSRGRKTYMRDGLMTRENRFRWLDSGDIQSIKMLRMIVEIAERTPLIDHWLPTREVGLVKQYLVHYDSFPDNLTVRISTPMIGERFSKKPMGLPFSTVDHVAKDIASCPAPQQGNQCRDCRVCWELGNVSYSAH